MVGSICSPEGKRCQLSASLSLFSAEILYSVNRFPAVEGSIIQISSTWNPGLVRSQLEKSLRFDSRNHHDRIHSLKLFAPKNDQKWMVWDSQFFQGLCHG